MPDTQYTHWLAIFGSDSGGELTWTSASLFNTPGSFTSFDVDGDGDVDSNDYWLVPDRAFSGFYYTAPNGQSYAIYESSNFPGQYYIPYNAADYDLSANIPFSGSTTNFQAENFVPTGNPVCFLAGSQISTNVGVRKVESMKFGDLVLTDGGKLVPVKWIGRQTVHTRFGPAERLMPVRFAAGSLGDGLPHTDLTVTADHGMLIDGVICHAGALVNGTTITRVPLSEMDETFTVYHIETEEHEIILANGAPAETFIDNVSRRAFDNFAEFEAIYGDVPEMEELPYPRAMSVRQVPEWIRVKLAGKLVA